MEPNNNQQYFLWYLIFLPFYLPTSSLLQNPSLGAFVAALWVVGQVCSFVANKHQLPTYLPTYSSFTASFIFPIEAVVLMPQQLDPLAATGISFGVFRNVKFRPGLISSEPRVLCSECLDFRGYCGRCWPWFSCREEPISEHYFHD